MDQIFKKIVWGGGGGGGGGVGGGHFSAEFGPPGTEFSIFIPNQKNLLREFVIQATTNWMIVLIFMDKPLGSEFSPPSFVL